MMAIGQALVDLGWNAHRDDQLSQADAVAGHPVRVMAVHRGQIEVSDGECRRSITPYIPGAGPTDDHPTVGDWLLIDGTTLQPLRILERMNLLKRRASGDPRKDQMIAANVDTVFIVSSCNQDFSVARLERYLVMSREVGVDAVVVLTKTDLTGDPDSFVAAARAIDGELPVETVDARDPASVSRLARWCGIGKTVALMGSSGVGKSTLVNTLRGSDSIATQAIRESDGTGRHTTTVREMHRLPHGGWLLDLPGMREVQLTEASAGIADLFDDVALAVQGCRFSDCSHGNEPGCAIRTAIETGAVTQERFDRWRQLEAGESANAARFAKRKRR